ncbi:hypothetical protein EVA_06409 [gut metagenome]|uniref:Uncharacterized protein n=1 Tax=gut metagenome TaxID=749906 RepID=J9GXL4_9ZZZZ
MPLPAPTIIFLTKNYILLFSERYITFFLKIGVRTAKS